MPTSEEECERLALAIADGAPIDWEGVRAAGLIPEHELRALRELEERRLGGPGALGPESRPGLVPAPNVIVGEYRLVEPIGRGGMGQVWLAIQSSLQRRVAVKFIHSGLVTERELGLFAREARASGRLNHPGLVTVHAHGQTEGCPWIAMELIEGGRTLRDFLLDAQRSDSLPAEHDREVARLVAEAAEAMQTAHEAGVLHRDLKPQNLLLTRSGHVKVTDFGLARLLDESLRSQSGELVGTCLYLSPEQTSSRADHRDPRSDVFSLGVVLYELLALRRPFEGDTVAQVLDQIRQREPPDPRTIRSRVPRDLAVIVGRALTKEPAGRYQSMGELAADLRRFLEGEPIQARPPTLPERALRWVRRHPGRVTVLVLAGLALSVISRLVLENVERGHAVLRLSALQRLEDLVAEADALWPALPERVGAYRHWISSAEALLAELPEHERRLRELGARSLPPGEEEPSRTRAQALRAEELERERRHVAYLRGMGLALDAGTPPPPPDPELPGVGEGALDLERRAWPLVDPAREDWGGEERGLALARGALALARQEQRPRVRCTLAWAWLANAFLDEAIAEGEGAVEEAAGPERLRLQEQLEALTGAVEESMSPEGQAAAERELAEAERRVRELEPRGELHQEPRFAHDEDRWWYLQLEKLVAGLRGLLDPEQGLLTGVSPEHGWGVRRRLDFALALEERTTTGTEARARWAEAQASIADQDMCPLYHGLRVEPQAGLLPLGRDPGSGLWEFADLQTGEPPRRGADGRLELTPEAGLVLVLIPGGAFRMGAQARDPGSPNYCQRASADEGPVHTVVLSPFLLSKYELTQGQWQRFTGRNPSRYQQQSWSPSMLRSGGWTPLQPVEQVSWNECARILWRLGLQLPSEAQWEYAARAGTGTLWWCGDDPERVAPAGNVADLYARDHGGANWSRFDPWDDGAALHAPVGSYAPNPFGLHDVIGNVWEWCQDVFEEGYYARSQRRNPVAGTPDSPADRVWRGGGCNEVSAEARSSYRSGVAPGTAIYIAGVRPARALVRGGT